MIFVSGWRLFLDIYIIEMRKLVNVQYKEIEDNLLYFEGFTNAAYNEKANDITHYPMFSNMEHHYLEVVKTPGIPELRWSRVNNENYQIFLGVGRGYKVREDKFFYNMFNKIIYKSTFKNENNINVLDELVLDGVNASDYREIVSFGGVIKNIQKDSGAFNGIAFSENVFYVRDRFRFYYKHEGLYYGAFQGSSKYNFKDKARVDCIFSNLSQFYVYVAESLIKCTVTGDITKGVMVPYVVFKHRDEVFGNRNIKKIRSLSSLKYSVSPSRIYSSVKVGYEKQRYELGNNGNDEFNFTNVYTTGITLNDNVLALVSPFRADSYGFEELARKRGKETSSSDSDQQVFAVLCYEKEGQYLLDRDYQIDGAYSGTVFNAGYAPVYMINANIKYLSSFADKLTFTSSDGCSDIVIDGQKVSDSIILDKSDRLFGVGNIQFMTDNYLIPNWENTVVEIEWDGRVYTGYLNSLECDTFGKEAFNYELIESV